MAAHESDHASSLAKAEKAIGGVTEDPYDEFEPSKSVEVIEAPPDMTQAIAGKLSIWTLLVVIMELCERFAYYGASLMFSIYLQKTLGRTKPQSIALNRVNQFVSYGTTILGAIVADQWVGKFKAILIFAVLYFIGLILLAISSADFSIKGGFGLAGFCISVYAFIGFGTGGIKSNVSSFMAEQIPIGYKPTKTPGVYEDSKMTVERGFRYFYWSVNIGAFAGQMICPQVAKHKSYALAFAIPAIMFFVGIVIFVAGSKNYVKKPPQGTVLLKVWRCMKYARKNKREGQQHWLDGALNAQGQEWNDEFVIGLQRSLRACKIFASVTGLEFAFSQAPAELKSVLTALFLFTNCGGALIGLILAIWGGDPQVLYVFAAETTILGVLAVVFYFCFRHYDDMVAEQEQFK
ncbi:hypothetical protein GQ54DRAFT_298844 [Martensiomyces pterosporus]|nr:hypothetical protein GQ54DRAFT_298844 [Martensiomyces pterosporus]